eukprot:FR736638.1.p1 GENE.FR736638.1~~FR736638.1.p1  ORF type:complete len:105 (-),score=7.44 FR736638.1:203-517(-)
MAACRGTARALSEAVDCWCSGDLARAVARWLLRSAALLLYFACSAALLLYFASDVTIGLWRLRTSWAAEIAARTPPSTCSHPDVSLPFHVACADLNESSARSAT